MSERFFSAAAITGDRATLDGDEARHLAAVMRLAVGDEAIVFDGSGCEFVTRVAAIKKHEVELQVVERRELSRELPVPITLAVALPKGDRQKWLVEKATELGVARLVPLVTERGVAQPAEGTLERLRRSVIEASKQCGRNRLMEIREAADASAYFQAAGSSDWRIIADPRGTPLSAVSYDAAQCAELVGLQFAVGPEGGFTDRELAAAREARWQPVSLGPRILRVETAAMALASWAALNL